MTTGGLLPVLRGRNAEQRATWWLRLRGYRILQRNYRIRGGEIDLIARTGNTLCFIEVKARAGNAYFGSLESVSPAQIQRILRAAHIYLITNPHTGPCRFDVLAMDRVGGKWKIQHITDAFENR